MSRTLTAALMCSMVTLGALPAAAQNSFDLCRPVSAPDTIVWGSVYSSDIIVPDHSILCAAPDVQPVQGSAPVVVKPAQVSVRVPAPQANVQNASIVLPALYGTYGVLQAMDIHSTMAALNNGAHEVSPLLRSTASNPWASTAIKAVTTAGTLYFVSRMAKHHRKAAIITMIAVNGVTAAVVLRNRALARRGR